MDLKKYRIVSLVLTSLIIISCGILLYFNLTHYKDESLMTLLGLLITLLISLVECFVSIKSFKRNDSMLYTLAFEQDGSINKFALGADIVLIILGSASTIGGIIYLCLLNYNLGLFFLGFGIFMLFNGLIYLTYVLVARNKYRLK